MNVEFRLLGSLEVLLSGQPVKVGGARQRKLLAILLLNANRVVPDDQLIDELWDFPPESVRQQVHNAVAGLRRVLAGAADQVRITRTDGGYRLEVADEAVDLHRFAVQTRAARAAETRGDLTAAIALLQSALSEWRGDSVGGIAASPIDASAASLNESRLAAREHLAALRLRSGESSALISELTGLVRQHPLRESLRVSLMQALYRAGRQADALVVYEEGRKALAEELGLDPSPALREVHLAILNGSAETAAATRDDNAQAMEVADRRPTRSYLPHDAHDFTGRTTELADLLAEARQADAATLVISAIAGMGGVGKTTLAIHLAHQVTDLYPDGQYFVDLQGFSAGVEPITAEQALEQLVRDSGTPPELVPSGVEARSALWRSQLAGSKALVVLDNAVDAAQIRPLLPGSAGVLVVVTSRRKLSALDGAVSTSLDVLSPQEAAEMFTKVIGVRRAEKEPEAVAEAVRLCGYLPLAIRIAAARLRDRTSWSVADLVDRIRDHAHRVRFLQVEDRNVMAVLKLSHRYLPELQRKVFRLLSLHPATEYEAFSTAALVGISVDEAEHCLDSLFEANLLKQNSPDQFHFHDLVRDCALQLLSEHDDEEEQRAASHRLLDYYLSAAHTWCQALATAAPARTPDVDFVPEQVRPVTSPSEAVAVLNTEFPKLVATARFAAEHGWHRHAWQLTCAVEPHMVLINYGGQSHELFASAVLAAKADGDLEGELSCLRGLASACRERGSKSEAIRHLDEALELARRLGDHDRTSTLLVDLGSLHLDQELIEEAEKNFLAAKVLIPANDARKQSSITNNLAVISRDLGKFDESLDHLAQALRLAPADAVRSRSMITWNVGMVLNAQGRHQQALEEFSRTLSASTGVEYGPGEALAHLGLCTAHRALGNLDMSFEHGRLALTQARHLKMFRVECSALNALGEAAFTAHDVDHAEKVYVQAEERAVHYAFVRSQARALEGFAHIARARGQVEDAERLWREAIELYPKGMIDARYPRQHLASIGDEKAACFRCRTI